MRVAPIQARPIGAPPIFSPGTRTETYHVPYAFICVIGALLFGFLATLLSFTVEGRWALMSGLLMALCIDLCIWFSVIRHNHTSFALKAAFLMGIAHKIYPFCMALSVPLSQDYLFPWSDYLFERPFHAIAGTLLPSAAILAVYLMGRLLVRPRGYDIPVKKMLLHTSNRFEIFLIVAGCIKLLYWFSITVLDNPIFYFVRVLITTVSFVPFIVGYCAFTFKRATIFWILIILFELVVAFLTGNRGLAFWPIMFFGAGFFIGLPNWSLRFKWSLFLAPIGILLLISAVWIGAMRDVVGRTDLITAIRDGAVVRSHDDATITRDLEIRVNIAYAGFRRLTVWGPLVIPAMTPDPIPFRGFNDFAYEVRAAAGLGIFALIDPNFRGSFYFANIHLNPYGFPVHVGPDGVRTSNAPMPVHVDGFTRGGWLAAFAFVLVAYSLVYSIERLLRSKLLPKYQPLFLMMLTFLCYITVLRFMSISFVHSLRQLIMEGILVFIVFFIADRTLKMMGQIERPPR